MIIPYDTDQDRLWWIERQLEALEAQRKILIRERQQIEARRHQPPPPPWSPWAPAYPPVCPSPGWGPFPRPHMPVPVVPMPMGPRPAWGIKDIIKLIPQKGAQS